MDFRRNFVPGPGSNGSTAPTNSSTIATSTNSTSIVLMRLVALLLACASASDAQFWQKKEYTEWSLQECSWLKKPDNSPWVQSNYVEGRLPHMPNEEAFSKPIDYYVATISSAWTIQRSYFCSTHMPLKYDKLAAKDKRVIEAKFIKQAFPDTVEFQVDYTGSDQMTGFWKAKTPEELMGHVALIVYGKRIQPLQVEMKSEVGDWGGFQVVFPRQIDGRPLLTAEMKEFHLEIDDFTGKIRLRFEPRKMVIRGKVVY